MLHGGEEAARCTGTCGSLHSRAGIFLPSDFGNGRATLSGGGSRAGICASLADPWPRLAARVASAAWSLEYLIRGRTDLSKPSAVRLAFHARSGRILGSEPVRMFPASQFPSLVP